MPHRGRLLSVHLDDLRGAAGCGHLSLAYGRNRAVQKPSEFELAGDHALMRKDGNRLIMEAAPPRSLLALLAILEPLAEEFFSYDSLLHS